MLIAAVRFYKRNPIWLAVSLVALLSLGNWIKGVFSFTDRSQVDHPMDDKGKGLTVQQAYALANSLYSAMNNIGGTDEDAIYGVLKPLTPASFGAVYNAFGKRNYSRVFGEGGMPGLSDKLDLIQWLREEMTEDEILHIKRINPDLRDLI